MTQLRTYLVGASRGPHILTSLKDVWALRCIISTKPARPQPQIVTPEVTVTTLNPQHSQLTRDHPGRRTALEPEHPFDVGERLAVEYRYPMDNPSLMRRAAVRFEVWGTYFVARYIHPDLHDDDRASKDDHTMVVDTKYILRIRSFDNPERMWGEPYDEHGFLTPQNGRHYLNGNNQ